MASIFKRGGRKGKGGYFIEYSERPGLRKTVYAGRDLAAAQALARKLEADAMLRRKGVIDSKADGFAAAEARPLSEHLTDFGAALRARGNTAKHAEQSRSRAGCVLAKVGRISELAPSKVQAALADLRAEADLPPDERHEGGRSLATCNHYLRAVKSFTRWLWRDGRAREDALAHLSAFKVTDAGQRRALTDAELSALLRVAHEGGPVLGMAGTDRAMLYAVAVGTGFRAGELASLTPESFALDASPPTVAVEAAYSKRRRRDVQPIPVALAEGLRPWLAEKQPGRSVFNVPQKTAKMMRRDLAAADIAYSTAEGVADFHSLRHTYVSRLVRSGINVKLVQELARHSTPVLTLGRYTHVDMNDKAIALATVPALEAPASTVRGTVDALLYEGSRDEPWQDAEFDIAEADVVESPCRGTISQLVASRASECARSSDGQSIGFLIRGPQVRILPGAPARCKTLLDKHLREQPRCV